MTYQGNTMDCSGSAGPSSTSSSLLERVKAREFEAWQRLVDLYAPLLYQWCRQCGLQAADAADVGQEVFGAVAASIATFRRDRPDASFRGWLWTITRNKIRDHFRRRRGQPDAQGGSEAQQRFAQISDQATDLDAAEPALHDRLEFRALELVRAGVEDRTWKAFWLVAVEQREPAVVAESLGITVQAVYGAIFRVRSKLRQELDGLID